MESREVHVKGVTRTRRRESPLLPGHSREVRRGPYCWQVANVPWWALPSLSMRLPMNVWHPPPSELTPQPHLGEGKGAPVPGEKRRKGKERKKSLEEVEAGAKPCSRLPSQG